MLSGIRGAFVGRPTRSYGHWSNREIGRNKHREMIHCANVNPLQWGNKDWLKELICSIFIQGRVVRRVAIAERLRDCDSFSRCFSGAVQKRKLDGVGPVDNGPFNNYLHTLVQGVVNIFSKYQLSSSNGFVDTVI